MPKRKAALVLALGIFVGLYFAFDLGQFLNLQTFKAQQENIATFQSAKPALTVLIFFSIYVLSTAVSLPGAALLTLASGAIFGVFWGTLIASFASSLGATLALIMSRFLLRDWVMQRFGHGDAGHQAESTKPRQAAVETTSKREIHMRGQRRRPVASAPSAPVSTRRRAAPPSRGSRASRGHR